MVKKIFILFVLVYSFTCIDFIDVNEDNPSNIYTIMVDGTGEKKLTDNTDWGYVGSAIYADDGNKIVYMAPGQNYGRSIFVMDADGKNKREISAGQNPSISSDGQEILFKDNYNDSNNIFKINIDGTNKMRITNAISVDSIRERCWDASFSDDGNFIVYKYSREVNWETVELAVYMVKSDGTDNHRLWPITSFIGKPRFAGNDTKVVMLLGGWGEWGYEEMRLGLYDIVSETMIEITPIYETESFDISPNGNTIVYETKSGIYHEIFTINIDGSDKTRLTENSVGSNWQPSFSPDGSKIVFVSTDEDHSYSESGNISIMNSDGTNRILLTDDDNRTDENPSISPDGSTVLFNN